MHSDGHRLRSVRPGVPKEAGIWDRHGKVNWEGMNQQKLKQAKFTYRIGRAGKWVEGLEVVGDQKVRSAFEEESG